MIERVLIDLSGTLHVDDEAIPNAQEALNRLRNTGVNIRFVTNTTKESRRTLLERLTKLKFNVSKDEIFSSLAAAKVLIQENNLKPFYLLSSDALEDFVDLQPQNKEEINAVVIGLAPECFQYEKLNEAFRFLLNGAKLIAIHEGKYYKRKDGLALGPGCFVKGLEYSAQCQAEVVGKPTVAFFQAALDNKSPENAIMIGDVCVSFLDVTDDVKGAMDAGLQAILVQTGKYRDGDENKIPKQPTAVCKSFVEAVDFIINQINK